jgi:hypothetical protein
MTGDGAGGGAGGELLRGVALGSGLRSAVLLAGGSWGAAAATGRGSSRGFIIAFANQPIPTAIARAAVPPPITSGQFVADGGGGRSALVGGASGGITDGVMTGGGTGNGGGCGTAGAASNPAAACVFDSACELLYTRVFW